MRPNITCRSCLRISSCSSTSLSAIELKESPELPDLVFAGEMDARLHVARCQRPRHSRQREDPADEGAAPEPARSDRDEQGDADGGQELSFERVRNRKRFLPEDVRR